MAIAPLKFTWIGPFGQAEAAIVGPRGPQGPASAWGQIDGSLADQEDLAEALGGKADAEAVAQALGEKADAEAVAQALATLASGPSLIIAPANAPDYAKRLANYVLPGTDDDVIIQDIIDNFPTYADVVRSAENISGGRYGSIQFTEGLIHFGNHVVVRADSVIAIRGIAPTSWRSIDPAGHQYEGGTMIYSTDPAGKILQYPLNSTTNTPTCGIYLENIEMRVFNPLTTQNNAALLLAGMAHGIIRNVKVLADRSTNSTRRIGKGIDLTAGARSSMKFLQNVDVAGFRDAGFVVSTTHLTMERCTAAGVGDGSSPCGFQIQGDFNNAYRNLHAFSTGIGIKYPSQYPMDIESVAFESLTNPVLLQHASKPALRFGLVHLNHDTSWTGDLANYCEVERLRWAGAGSPGARVRTRVVVTVPDGQTSGSAAHSLIAAPRANGLTCSPTAEPSSQYWVTADATNVTVTMASAAAGDTTFVVEARAA